MTESRNFDKIQYKKREMQKIKEEEKIKEVVGDENFQDDIEEFGIIKPNQMPDIYKIDYNAGKSKQVTMETQPERKTIKFKRKLNNPYVRKSQKKKRKKRRRKKHSLEEKKSEVDDFPNEDIF